MMGVRDETNRQIQREGYEWTKDNKVMNKEWGKPISVHSSAIKEREYISIKAFPESTFAWKCSTGAPILVLSHYVSPGT